MATFTVEGTVKVIMEAQSFASGFTKREFVVTLPDERFPQDIKFAALKEKMSILEGVESGDRVSVTFDLRGNEYNSRYFVDLVAWKLEKTGEKPSASSSEEDVVVPVEPAEDVEDLPF